MVQYSATPHAGPEVVPPSDLEVAYYPAETSILGAQPQPEALYTAHPDPQLPTTQPVLVPGRKQRYQCTRRQLILVVVIVLILVVVGLGAGLGVTLKDHKASGSAASTQSTSTKPALATATTGLNPSSTISGGSATGGGGGGSPSTIAIVSPTTLSVLNAKDAALNDQLTTASVNWWFYTGQSETQVNALCAQNNARLTQVRVDNPSGPTFSVLMIENTGVYASQWWWYYGPNAATQGTNRRLISLDPYFDAGGTLQFAVVQVPNTGAQQRGWWWYYGVNNGSIGALLQQNGARLVSLRGYIDRGSLVFAVLMVENSGPDTIHSEWYTGISADLGDKIPLNGTKLRPIAMDSNPLGGWDVVLVTSTGDNWGWWFGVDYASANSNARRTGLRIVDVSTYQLNGAKVFIMAEDWDVPKRDVGRGRSMRIRSATDNLFLATGITNLTPSIQLSWASAIIHPKPSPKMDPFTALGLAANILTFVDFSTKLITTTMDIYESGTGWKREDESGETVANEMRSLASKLLPPSNSQLVAHDKALCQLATECHVLSERILSLFEKIKAKDPNSKPRALWAAVKGRRYEKQKLEIQNALNNCRSQLHLQLQWLTSNEILSKLDGVTRAAKDTAVNLDMVLSQTTSIQLHLERAELNQANQAQSNQILRILGTAKHIFFQKKILETIAFSGMNQRYDEVEHPHQETLCWILNGDAQEEDGERIAAKKLFTDWLTSGAGIFHLAGKLGSGKSTLMKFLCDHPRTRELLQRWAGSKELILSHFFFWKPGTELQKSLQGLVRSLLYTILRAVPALIPEIFPSVWSTIQESPSNTWDELFPTSAILQGFIRLMNYTGTFENHRFCFFIDGLDEYQGRIQEDPKHLVEQLCRWTEMHQDSFKLCVSSREYNVFMNNLSSQQRLRLQQLTRKDMELYARDKLAHIPQDQDLARIVTDRSEGIFLWVALVIRRLREHFDDGVEFLELVRDLDSIPQELDSLYDHILQSLDSPVIEKAYQTFSLVLRSDAYNLPLSLYAYSFLDRYRTDKSFAMADDFETLEAADLKTEQHRKITELAHKRLNGICKGLVEVVKSDHATKRRNRLFSSDVKRLAFTHRSVVEFLQQPKLKGVMESQLQKFCPEEAVSQLLLAEMRHGIGGWIGTTSVYVCTQFLIRMRIAEGLDAAPYSYLENLSSLLGKHPSNIHSANPELVGHFMMRMDLGEFYVLGWDSSSQGGTELSSPLYLSALWGNHPYVQWKLENDPAVRNKARELRLLWLCVQCGFSSFGHGRSVEQALRVFDTVHEKGLFFNQPDTLYPSEWRPEGDTNEGLTPWQHFILRIVTSHKFTESIPSHLALEQLAEKLLILGVEQELSITFSSAAEQCDENENKHPQLLALAPSAVDSLQGKRQSEPSMSNSDEGQSNTPGRSPTPSIPTTWHITCVSGKAARKTTLHYGYPIRHWHVAYVLWQHKRPVFLRDIFEAWDPPNKARLLELLQETDYSTQNQWSGKDRERELVETSKPGEASNVKNGKLGSSSSACRGILFIVCTLVALAALILNGVGIR